MMTDWLRKFLILQLGNFRMVPLIRDNDSSVYKHGSDVISVTRLGDLLGFGQLFKAFGTN